jgi:hypothetical protein
LVADVGGISEGLPLHRPIRRRITGLSRGAGYAEAASWRRRQDSQGLNLPEVAYDIADINHRLAGIGADRRRRDRMGDINC